ncbi:TIGR03862 family flavoprotein [Paenalcaligenes niemegkensis]|uniref:TIGR03862 family flavoprotein n=1 Tax=Paenalcaligenes niemegkensis TaxID=2895469 RepID=UPI001EE8BBE0|nr:TIGR03862 family flavoprotein [Paenalcaligenes niemegkensis]MCQ9617573.1 TIGR03862 family flavoprotein [Paenalcaligenes niemegkensis]
MPTHSVAVIGAGPAGLMAAETLANAGFQVDVFDAMPSVGRKFLLAGRGGLNLTHSEESARFLSRYGEHETQVAAWLGAFSAQELRQWTHDLGIETFVGSSGRVFPKEMKAAPLLRTWLQRLRASGVRIHSRHRWTGWNSQELCFETPQGMYHHQASATLLAMGGASWPRLGSDGRWLTPLKEKGVSVAPLLPANCGFLYDWSPYFSQRFAGQPLKSVAMAPEGLPFKRGEGLITETGIEGSLVYAWSSLLRDRLLANGSATLHIDLLPDRTPEQIYQIVAMPRGSRSWASHLDNRLRLKGVKMALLRECADASVFENASALSSIIKKLPLTLSGIKPIAEAISSAGGVRFQSIDEKLMLKALPGVFCAGEMIDWEAPTGGYLLTACFASGKVAAMGVEQWLK